MIETMECEACEEIFAPYIVRPQFACPDCGHQHEIPQDHQDYLYRYRGSEAEAAMVFLNGSNHSFRCHCGCNIFNTRPKSQYECNACGELYQGS